MDSQIFFAFVFAAFFESIHPGPTIALVLDTRMVSGRAKALRIVAGITIANITWVAIALLIYYSKLPLLSGWLHSTVGFLAIPFLTYLASVRILHSVAHLITKQSQDTYDIANQNENAFLTGFMAHAINPLSIGYYLATFSVVISGQPLRDGILIGCVPILMDIFVFSTLATIAMPLSVRHFPRGVLQLLSGLFFVYMVGLASSGASSANFYNEGTGIVMLLALLFASIVVSRRLVLSRKRKSGRELWRVVGIWDSWFKVIAVAGAILTVGSAFSVGAAINAINMQQIRICFVVAAVIAAALSFAKAFGELQEERFPTSQQDTIKFEPECWQASEVGVGVVVIVLLIAMFLLMVISGFQLPELQR